MAQQKDLARQEARSSHAVEAWDTFEEMERLIRDFFYNPGAIARYRPWSRLASRELVPEIDLRESDSEFVLSALLPGMEKDDIEIDVTDDSITISGERKSEEDRPGERYHVRQQSRGSINVCYSLPSNVKPDEVKANYHNGVLEVTMPKAQTQESKRIEVED